MPFTINGIGTTYYGKQNVHVRQSVCDSCRAGTTLTSYDTASYFVIAFIPALPLGKKRVVDECARCRRHRVMSLSKWTAFRTQTIEQAVTAATEVPHDAERTRAALEAAIAFDDDDAFLTVATIAEANHARDAETLRALAGGYAYLNHPIDAEETYRRLVALNKDDHPASEQLAVAMMRQSRPDDAAPIVERVFQDESEDGLWLVQLLIEAYQAQGNHEAAHSLLNRCERTFPEVTKDVHHKHLRKVSTKNSMARTAVPSPSLRMGTRLQSADDPKAAGSRTPGKIAAVIAMLLIPALVVAWLLASHAEGNNRKVYVVNGTNVQYRVDINGQTCTLAPKHRTAVQLREGEVIVRVLDSAVPVPEQRAVIVTPFLTRLFRDHLFVINPDRAALLVWEQTVYSGRNQPMRDDPYKTYTGELLHEFEGIDYPFREFPDQITTSHSGDEFRERLEHVRDATPGETTFVVLRDLGPEAAGAYTRHAARFEPDREELFNLMSVWSDHDELVRFLRPQLDHRPLRLEWHRVYQDTMGHHEPARDLLSTYRAYLNEAPDDPDRIYLHARLLEDPDAQEAAMLRALDHGLETDRPIEWLLTGMLGSGRFDEALALMDRIADTEGREAMVLTARRHALVALGRVEDALALDAQRHDLAPDNAQVAAEYMVLLLRSRRTEEASRLVGRFMEMLVEQEADAAALRAWTDHFDAVALYQAGDEAAFGAAVADSSVAWLRFRGAVCLGQLERALEILETDEDAAADVDDYLSLAIAAHRAQQAALFRSCLTAAADLWDETMPEGMPVSAWLRGTETPTAEAVRGVRLYEVRTKMLLLTVIGLEHPAERSACFELARKLNFDTRYPYLLVSPVLGESRTAGERPH